ncbi:MAG: glycosyltransferase family 4 protein, partial [Thermoplasmata archaeon]
ETVSGCADLTIVQAEWEKEQLAAQGAPIDKMRVLAHGVDTGIFHPGPGDRARAKLPDGRMLLSVGSNTDRKNVPGSMLLLKKYLDAGGDPSTFLYLHTSTQGWYFLDCFVNALGFAGKKKVFVLGSDEGNPVTLFGQDEEDLANIYRTADAFLQPTFAEGFGVTILEALASGLPAVMTDTPILRELYSEFPGALFMPSRQEIASTWGFRWFPDTDVGATQVRDALEHGKYAHVDVPRKFLWSQIVSDLEGMLESLVPK